MPLNKQMTSIREIPKIRLTVKHISQTAAFYNFFGSLGISANNERNPIFGEVREYRGQIGDLPMTRYEKFNEMTFEAYCKKAIDNAVKKERQKKAARGKSEQSRSVLTDSVLYALSVENAGTEQDEEPCCVFHMREMDFPICDPKLSDALSYLMPRDRETVGRRRKAAMVRLRKLMENSA